MGANYRRRGTEWELRNPCKKEWAIIDPIWGRTYFRYFLSFPLSIFPISPFWFSILSIFLFSLFSPFLLSPFPFFAIRAAFLYFCILLYLLYLCLFASIFLHSPPILLYFSPCFSIFDAYRYCSISPYSGLFRFIFVYFLYLSPFSLFASSVSIIANFSIRLCSL